MLRIDTSACLPFSIFILVLTGGTPVLQFRHPPVKVRDEGGAPGIF